MTAEEFYFKWKNEHAGVRWRTHEMMEAYAEKQIKELEEGIKRHCNESVAKHIIEQALEQ